MSEDKKKEILKAYHYGYGYDIIAKNCGVSEDEVRKIVEDGEEYMKKLEVRKYD